MREPLLLQANFTDDYIELSNCYVYTIDGLDMFVVVKKQSVAGKCTCSPVRPHARHAAHDIITYCDDNLLR